MNMERSEKMKRMILILTLIVGLQTYAQAQTYAEKLGWSEGSRVLMIHADDAGMSHASNQAIIATLEAGTVTSASIMMPCPWVPGFVAYLRENPGVDAGLHLTFTSEWKPYRWAPVAGRSVVPGLVDASGYMHANVRGVVENATPDEVEAEIRAQIALAEQLGIEITHLDSHMGTLYSRPAIFERYVNVAIEKQIPLLIGAASGSADPSESAIYQLLKPYLERIWEAGLPVLDVIDTSSYDWKIVETRQQQFIDTIRNLKPGVTWFNVHPTMPTEEGKALSLNREILFSDYHVLISPEVKKAIEEEGIILTTWRELKQRRNAIK